jgi:glycosyltransferase 2 family protein
VAVADRRSLGLWFRTVATLVMLGFLLPRVHLNAVIPEWDLHTGLWLAAAVAVTAAGIVASAIRWQAVLVGLGRHCRARTLLHHYLAGLFVGNFLPSTIGGDVLRVRRLGAQTGDSAEAFASVVLERLSGMVVLPVITLTALAFNPGLRALGTASLVAALVSILTLLFLGVLLFGVSHPRVGRRVVGTTGWQQFAGAVHLGAARFRRHPRATAGVIVSALAYQLIVVMAALLAARALNIHNVGITAVLAFVPAVSIVQVIPISLGGLGVREGAFVLFLHPLDVTTGRAVALGLLIYGLNLLVSLLGAPSFAMGHRPRAKAMA